MDTLILVGGAVVTVLGFGVFFFYKPKSDKVRRDPTGLRATEPGQQVTRRRLIGRDTVSVNVDPVRCARFGFCEHEAPNVFQIRREGRFTYKSSVPVDEVEPVIRAVEICPARAIRVGGVHTWSSKR